MDIIIDNFRLSPTPAETARDRWDLYNIQTGQTKTGNDKRDDAFAFGMTLSHAIDLIVHTNLSNKDAIVGLQEYVQAYTKEKDRLTSMLKGL
jgi:hypothetical protein